MTLGGTVTTEVALFWRVMTVGSVGARLIVTCKTPVRPLARVKGAVTGEIGASAVTTGGGGTIFTVAVAVPFNVAVTGAVPMVRPLTETGAVVSPAGTVTLTGTPTMVALVVVIGTTVSVACAALRVTVSVPVAPCTTASGLGVSESTCGGCGVTVTVACLLMAPRVAVTCAVPVARAVTVKMACVWLGGTVTVCVAGIWSTVGWSTESARSVGLLWAALRVTVRVPMAPTTRD